MTAPRRLTIGAAPAGERAAVAEAVGVGAVIYNDLYQDPRRNISLDWGRMLATEGNSATYLQYSHARCRSILRRAEGETGRQGDRGTRDEVYFSISSNKRSKLPPSIFIR